MNLYKYIIFFIFHFKNSIISQTDIAIINSNTINVKLTNIGKPSYLNIDGTGKLFSSLPIYHLEHFSENKIKLPTKIDKKSIDIAIAEISAITTKNQNITDTIYLLVVNYKSDYPTVYISKNSNLNFNNNDKILDKNLTKATFYNKTKKGEIEYIIDLSKSKSPNSYIASSHDTINAVSKQYFIPIWKNNIKYGEFKIRNTSINIALYDANNNGVFNEKNIDMLIINPLSEGDYFTPAVNSSSKKISAENYFKISDSLCFRISFIDGIGKFILLDNTTLNSHTNYLKIFNKIPDCSYINSDSTLMFFRDFNSQSKYLYVNILTEYCKPCIKKIPTLDSIAFLYKNKLNIISLLDRGSFVELKNLIKQFNIKSAYGLSNTTINFELHLSGYPYGILFDKNGSLIKEVRFVDDLDDFMKTHE